MLEEIATDIWGLRSELRAVPGVYLPLRTTIVRLSDGGLLLHAPIRLDDAQAAAVDRLGPVRHIVAPSGFHHLFAGHAKARWPAAVLTVSPRVVKKRLDLTAEAVLGQGPCPWPAAELTPLEFEGMPALREFAFFHGATGSVLLTDAVFNIAQEKGFLAPLWFRIWGTHHKFAQSGLFRLAIKDKAAAAASARRILAWDIKRVIPCHGEVLAEDAQARLAAAFAPMLGA